MTFFDVVAIGVLSGQIQVPVAQLKRIAERLGVAPSARINGIPHFSSEDAERIAAAVRAGNLAGPIGDRTTIH